MVVDPIKLFHGGQISFLKEVYFCIRKELISQRKDISLYENMTALTLCGRCENALSKNANWDLSANVLFIIERETAFALVENPLGYNFDCYVDQVREKLRRCWFVIWKIISCTLDWTYWASTVPVYQLSLDFLAKFNEMNIVLWIQGVKS